MYSRSRRWQETGRWDRILFTLQAEAVHDRMLNRLLTMIDGTTIRAYQQAAGANKGADSHVGRSRGGGGGGANSIS